MGSLRASSILAAFFTFTVPLMPVQAAFYIGGADNDEGRGIAVDGSAQPRQPPISANASTSVGTTAISESMAAVSNTSCTMP